MGGICCFSFGTVSPRAEVQLPRKCLNITHQWEVDNKTFFSLDMHNLSLLL